MVVGAHRGGGPNFEKVGGAKGWGGEPEGWAPEGWRAEGWGTKISRFSLFLLKFHSLCSLQASSRGLSVVFEVLGPFKMHVWISLGHRVRAPAARFGGAARVSHDDPESPDVHFGVPRPSKTPTKIQREDAQREHKE